MAGAPVRTSIPRREGTWHPGAAVWSPLPPRRRGAKWPAAARRLRSDRALDEECVGACRQGPAVHGLGRAAPGIPAARPGQRAADLAPCCRPTPRTWPKFGTLMDESEHDVLAYMAFPAQHRTKLHSTNTLECLNKEVQRRADVVGIFPSEASIIRLIGAVLLKANNEWQMQHRYMSVEAMGEMLSPASTNETLQLPPRPARAVATSSSSANSTTLTDMTEAALQRENSCPLPPRHSQGSRANPDVNCGSRRQPPNRRANL